MILLSFDLEEFDLPAESGQQIPFEQQMAVSIEGAQRILELMRKNQVRATFFCTARFAENAPDLIRTLVAEGHEIASHGYYHSAFEPADLLRSRQVLEQLSGQPVVGFRMARMMPVDEHEIAKAGYRYNSSLNPTCIPGRYNHLKEPRTCFLREGVWQIPSGTTPTLRLPLFWLTYHNFPPLLYHAMVKRAVRHDGYLVTYLHPWEFTDLNALTAYRISPLIRRNCGERLVKRMDRLIGFLKKEGNTFGTLSEFVATLDHERSASL